MYALILFDRHCAPDDPNAVPPAPDEWWLSQLCEAFQLAPVTGGAGRQPLGLSKTMLSLRSYKQAHDLISGKIPADPDKIPEAARKYVGDIKQLRALLDQLEAEEEDEQEAREQEEVAIRARLADATQYDDDYNSVERVM